MEKYKYLVFLVGDINILSDLYSLNYQNIYSIINKTKIRNNINKNFKEIIFALI